MPEDEETRESFDKTALTTQNYNYLKGLLQGNQDEKHEHNHVHGTHSHHFINRCEPRKKP